MERNPSGEHQKITSVVIPADDAEPLYRIEFDTSDSQKQLAQYRQIVHGGYVEAVPFNRPASTLYLNDEGKNLQLPQNNRATMLAWMHQPVLRYNDLIAGNAFLTGPLNHEGVDTDVPKELVKLLLGSRTLRAEIQIAGDDGWYGNDLKFDHWTHAYATVLDLGWRWRLVRDMRVAAAEG